jgi:phytoene dehydrogenase-like protein
VSRTIVLGAGHNGLIAACYLARAGLAPLVLERRSVVGGAAVTEEFAPGFRASLTDVTGPLRQEVVRDLGLDRRVAFIRPDTRLAALAPDGRALLFADDVVRTMESVRAFSAEDARRYPDFCGALERLGAVLGDVRSMTPPPLDAPAAGGMWDLLKIGRRFRSLERTDAFRLLRYLPMPVADLVAEWFESDLLRAAVASRGVFGTALGPWSAGTGAVLLMNAALDPAPGGASVLVRGGTGALTAAMADAAREAGAEIRTGAAVSRILVDDNGAVAGVRLEDGSEIEAVRIVSGIDPKTTMLSLVDPLAIDPGFALRMRNVRARGTLSKIDFAVSALPRFQGLDLQPGGVGRLHIAPGIDYLERAYDASKYGEFPEEPWLTLTIPTLDDPSLAPPGAHVVSVYVQYTPYQLSRNRSWNDVRDALATAVLRVLDRYCPGFPALVDDRRVVTPLDLENTYGLPGGHILHAEPSLDQMFVMRPVFGWAQYRTPIDGLFLCSSGTHPGGGLTGESGANAAREVLRGLKHARGAGGSARR